MRINAYIAQTAGISRRQADRLIANGQITVNSKPALIGQQISDADVVRINGEKVKQPDRYTTVMLNKPIGYVCSRNGQGSKTIYDILPAKYANLKPVGRLDKDSSGLILLTNDGRLAHTLTHPRFQKEKLYFVTLDKQLTLNDKHHIEQGIELEDGKSKLQLKKEGSLWHVTMTEGRNRQIRRTFEAVGYTVTSLHRITFGNYKLNSLKAGNFKEVPS